MREPLEKTARRGRARTTAVPITAAPVASAPVTAARIPAAHIPAARCPAVRARALGAMAARALAACLLVLLLAAPPAVAQGPSPGPGQTAGAGDGGGAEPTGAGAGAGSGSGAGAGTGAPAERWFVVDALNPGLGPPPEALDRSTPQASVETFLHLAGQGDFDAAAHMLDLAPIEARRQARLGPVRARQLAQVIERRVTVDWGRLMDRPDGLDDQAGTQRAVAGEPRRSVLLRRVDLAGREVPIRLARLRPEGGAPVWVFSRQTVENLPELAAATAAPALERILPEPLRRESPLLGLRWWEIVAVPLLVGLALLVALAAAHALTKLSPGPRRPRLHAIFRSVRLPLTLLLATLLVWAAAGPLFAFSAAISVVLWPLIAAGFAMAVLTFLLNTLDRIVDRLQSTRADDLAGADPAMERRREVATTLSAVRRVAIVLAFVAGVAAVLAAADVFSTLGWSLLASAGALTLLLGIAARQVLANVMASLQIAFNRSAKIGDELLFKGYICHVERINFTFVQLRVWTGERLVVPVTDFVEEIYENWTLQDGSLTRKVELKLRPDADLPAIRDLYHRVLDEGDWTLADPMHRGVHVTGQDVFGIDVLFRVPTIDAQESWVIACDVQERLVAEIVKLEHERGATWFPDAGAAEAA